MPLRTAVQQMQVQKERRALFVGAPRVVYIYLRTDARIRCYRIRRGYYYVRLAYVRTCVPGTSIIYTCIIAYEQKIASSTAFSSTRIVRGTSIYVRNPVDDMSLHCLLGLYCVTM